MQPIAQVQTVFSAQTATTALGVVDCRSFSDIVVFVTGTGTTSSGVVTIEEAHAVDYAGIWSAVSTVNASDVTGGATKAVHLSVAAYIALRVRISTVIGGGGSVAVTVAGR